MEISDRIRIHMTAHGFWLTVYISRIYGLHRIYAVYGPYMDRICRWCSIPSNSSLFCSFWSNFLFRATSYWALPLLPFSIDAGVLHYYLYNVLLVVMVVELPFCTGIKLYFGLFGLSRPSSLTIHFLVIGSCVLSSSRATKWNHYELILSKFITPHIPYIRKYGVETVRRNYSIWKSHVRFWPTLSLLQKGSSLLSRNL